MYIHLIILVFVLCTASLRPEKKAWHLMGAAQGTTWQLTYYTADSIIARSAIDSIFLQLDSSLSNYKSWSLISRFNAAADSIEVDDHLLNVVKTALQVHTATNGIFDITIAPLGEAWGVGPKKLTELPDSLSIQQARNCVNSRYLSLNGRTLYKRKACVQIDVNGIAQGYSTDIIAGFLESKGVFNYLVELGGEIRVKGRKYPELTVHRIGIEAPVNSEFEAPALQKVIEVKEGAITTSGSYRKFREANGKTITHIIDPRTGYPIRNELISVTVFARSAIIADAYDNALLAMGLQKALEFTEQHPELAAYFIYRKKDGTITDTTSAIFNKFMMVE